jgi:hypothetical protein
MLRLLTLTIKGPKSLNENIKKVQGMGRNIKEQFKSDCGQSLACVEEPTTFLGSTQFDVRLCIMDHESMIYSATQLNQDSQFLQAEEVVNEGLKNLMHIYKMLLTNEHQRNTTVKALKKTRKQVSAALKSNLRCSDEDFELEPVIPGDKEIRLLIQQQIQQVQQNHGTVARNLCKQAEMIVRALQTRDILAYKLAADNTIQKIIRHADLCRKFIADCLKKACVEYCASEWWMKKQDPNDRSSYYLTAVVEGEPTRFKAPVFEYSTLVSGRSAPPRILIEVQNEERSPDGSCQIVFSEYLNEELAKEILNDDAVRAFEADEIPKTYVRRYGKITSLACIADEAVQQSWSKCNAFS